MLATAPRPAVDGHKDRCVLFLVISRYCFGLDELFRPLSMSQLFICYLVPFSTYLRGITYVSPVASEFQEDRAAKVEVKCTRLDAGLNTLKSCSKILEIPE